MAVYQNVEFDINQVNTFSLINTKQGDSGRILRIQLTLNGEPYKIPISAHAIFRAIKPDDTFIYNSCTVNQDGTCYVVLTQEVLSVSGKIYGDISIIQDRTTVSSVSFVIFNEKFPQADTSISSSSQYTALANYVSLLSGYSSKLDTLANGRGITASLDDGVLTVVKNDSV